MPPGPGGEGHAWAPARLGACAQLTVAGLTSARSCRPCASCRARSSSRVAVDSASCSRPPSASFKVRACTTDRRGRVSAEAPAGAWRAPGSGPALGRGSAPEAAMSPGVDRVRPLPVPCRTVG